MDFTDTISFKEMIEYMDGGQPFSLSFVTSDKKRGNGGEWIVIKWAVKFMSYNKQGSENISANTVVESGSRNPKHFENSTRNLKLKNGEVRKIHLRLVRVFNNKIVL